jgi:hypothetical protein
MSPGLTGQLDGPVSRARAEGYLVSPSPPLPPLPGVAQLHVNVSTTPPSIPSTPPRAPAAPQSSRVQSDAPSVAAGEVREDGRHTSSVGSLPELASALRSQLAALHAPLPRSMRLLRRLDRWEPGRRAEQVGVKK